MRLPLLLLACSLVACADPDVPDGDDVEKLEATPPPGKEDSQNRRGLLVATNTTRTQVWTARNKWEDRDTPAARAAGLAWTANSGLDWDEKYAQWVDSLSWIAGADGYSQTVELTTPWGKTLPSPALECAEMALFLRITFAAWYELPLFFESQDSTGDADLLRAQRRAHPDRRCATNIARVRGPLRGPLGDGRGDVARELAQGQRAARPPAVGRR